MTRTVIHLLDDTTPGGVTRMLDYIRKSPALAASARHEIRVLPRGRWSAPRLEADVIVSHLSVSWRNLPMLTALRALHPATELIHVEHSYCEGFVAANPTPRLRFGALMRTAYALFDRIVAVSRGQADWLTRSEFVGASRLVTIPPMADLAPFLALPGPRSRHRIGLVGRLHAQKGFDLAITAFRRAAGPEMTLDVFGDGPDMEKLVELAGDDPRIRFHGWLDDSADAVAACDTLLVPSRWEPYGLVVLEGLAAGRLVLCSQADGLTDHVTGGAIAVGGASIGVWEDAIRSLGTNDRGTRAVRGRQHARAAIARFEEAWAALVAPAAEQTVEDAIAA